MFDGHDSSEPIEYVPRASVARSSLARPRRGGGVAVGRREG